MFCFVGLENVWFHWIFIAVEWCCWTWSKTFHFVNYWASNGLLLFSDQFNWLSIFPLSFSERKKKLKKMEDMGGILISVFCALKLLRNCSETALKVLWKWKKWWITYLRRIFGTTDVVVGDGYWSGAVLSCKTASVFLALYCLFFKDLLFYKSKQVYYYWPWGDTQRLAPLFQLNFFTQLHEMNNQ